MNGKKAKLLRSLAGPKQETKYSVMPGTERKKFFNVSPVLEADGTTKLDENGVELWNRYEWVTRTILVAPGTRNIYKVLKNIYYNRTRGLTRNIVKPPTPVAT